MGKELQVELRDIVEDLHIPKRTFCVFLQLLKIAAVLIEVTLPVVYAAA